MVQTSTTSTRYNYWNVKTLAGNSGANAIHTENNDNKFRDNDASQAMILFHHDTRVRHSSIAYSETELMTVNKGLPKAFVTRISWPNHQGFQTVARDCWLLLSDTTHSCTVNVASVKVVHERQLKHIFLLK